MGRNQSKAIVLSGCPAHLTLRSKCSGVARPVLRRRAKIIEISDNPVDGTLLFDAQELEKLRVGHTP